MFQESDPPSPEKQRLQRKSDTRHVREQRHTRRADRWETFKLLVALPLVSVFFTAFGLVMLAGAILSRDSGAFGFALMVLGIGVGPIGFNIARYLEFAEERAARRSAPPAAGERRRSRASARNSKTSPWLFLLIIPVLFAAACWAIGVGFMLFGYGPDQLISSGSKSLRVRDIAVLVWGGLLAVGITVLVRYIKDRREK